jgi:hypothetical protein
MHEKATDGIYHGLPRLREAVQSAYVAFFALWHLRSRALYQEDQGTRQDRVRTSLFLPLYDLKSGYLII